MYFVGTTVTQVARNWESVKIRKIEIFSSSTATTFTGLANPFNSIQLEWLSANAPSKVQESVGNFEHPSHISSKPPQGTLAGFWSISGSNESEVLFRLSGSNTTAVAGTNTGLPPGTTIDLHLEVINQEDTTPVLTTVAAATVGQNYVRSFDGTVAASQTFAPLSYFTL